MTVNVTARYKTVARFEEMTIATLPVGATVKAMQDRRGRLVMQCAWSGSHSTASVAARIVVSGETLSIYWTATGAQRLAAQLGIIFQ
jgi:hypothetical protein